MQNHLTINLPLTISFHEFIQLIVPPIPMFCFRLVWTYYRKAIVKLHPYFTCVWKMNELLELVVLYL